MTKNDAYKYARMLRRRAWHRNLPPWDGTNNTEKVRASMQAEGYSEADYLLVRAWLKVWASGRRF